MTVRGGCLCGSVAFEVDLPFVKFVKCHCSRCRGATGSAFATNAYVLPTAFRWLSGARSCGALRLAAGAEFLDLVLP